MQLIDGKAIAATIKKEIAEDEYHSVVRAFVKQKKNYSAEQKIFKREAFFVVFAAWGAIKGVFFSVRSRYMTCFSMFFRKALRLRFTALRRRCLSFERHLFRKALILVFRGVG